MIKPLRLSKKAVLFVLIILSALVFNAPYAMATSCAVPGTTSRKGATATKSLTKELTSISTKIVKIQAELVLNLEMLKTSVVQAINGVSQAVTSSATTIMTTDQKLADVVLTQELEQEKRLRQASAAANAQPTAADCVQATGKQYVAEGKILEAAIADTIGGNLMDIYTGVGGGFDVSDSDTSIGKKADAFRFYMEYLCDPETNGGLMPTAANPIDTTSGPLWCGMSRAAGEEGLAGLHIEIPRMLFKPSRLDDNPRYRSAAMLSILMILGEPLDKVYTPDLGTAAGQRKYMNSIVANSAKMALPMTVFERALARIFPAQSDGGSAWTRDILLAGLPPEIYDQRRSQLEGNVSQSQFDHAMIKQFTDNQYMMNIQGMSQGGYDRQIINLGSMLAYIQSERLREAELSNALSAAIYVEQIGGS